MSKVIKIADTDNVGIALNKLNAGDTVYGVVVREDIPVGHKLALQPIDKGENVIKYGSPIGHATKQISPGDWVHTHNVKTNLRDNLEYRYVPEATDLAVKELPNDLKTFSGYLRSDGRAGIRNEIWILPTVSCTNQIASLIAKRAWSQLSATSLGSKVDGVYEFKHPYGCSQLGEDHQNTQKLLAALAKHPNAAGVLVLGLGCENNSIKEFKNVLEPFDDKRVRFLECQSVEDEVTEGTQLIMELAAHAASFKREDLPVSYLSLGLKCGGSDGFSGITANPLVGRVSDLLIASGGSSVLTEVPEMFGAEHLLMNRAKDEAVFSQIVKLINNFKEYFRKHHQPIYENPSPGNKDGGITTLEDKSLGCTEKGGTSKVIDVLEYGSRVVRPGLNLLNSPGNDLVASTALAAAGCQVVLFTTGRGTPFGTCVPTLKIATNSRLAGFKGHWMDFDAGKLVDGADFEKESLNLLRQILDVASGTKSTNEEMEFREIAIWKGGVTL